jgi:hypothetical protein
VKRKLISSHLLIKHMVHIARSAYWFPVNLFHNILMSQSELSQYASDFYTVICVTKCVFCRYFFPTYENDSFLCHLNDHQDDMAELHVSQQM